MNSFIPWVGGKGKLLWIINKLMPDRYTRFIDVFGGSGTVTMCRPIQRGCMEVYNDFNGNLTNLFCCVKNRPMALLAELGFLPLNTRDDFNVLYKFFSKGEFTDDYLKGDDAASLFVTSDYTEAQSTQVGDICADFYQADGEASSNMLVWSSAENDLVFYLMADIPESTMIKMAEGVQKK